MKKLTLSLAPVLAVAATVSCMAQTTLTLQTGVNCGVGVPSAPEYACHQNVQPPVFANWGTVAISAGVASPEQQVVFTSAGPNSVNGTLAVTDESIQVVLPYTPYHNSTNLYILTFKFSGIDSITGMPVSGTATLPYRYEYLSSGGRGGHSSNYTISGTGSVTIDE
jgi:hypothetical protein